MLIRHKIAKVKNKYYLFVRLYFDFKVRSYGKPYAPNFIIVQIDMVRIAGSRNRLLFVLLM